MIPLEVKIFLCIYVGAIVAHILTVYADNFKGLKPFLTKIFPNKPDVFYDRLDLVFLPVIGSLLAFVLISPVDFKSAISSGLSWTGTVFTMLQLGKKA